MFTVQFQIVYLMATVGVFCGVAWGMRARGRRVMGAVCSVGPFTALSGTIDEVGAWGGWWSYPSCVDPPHPPLAVYLGQALLFVGA